MTFRRESIGHLTNWSGRLFSRRADRKLRPLGISVGQIPVLLALSEQDGLSQRQLVERMAIEQSTISATLKRMEAAALVIREGDPRDGRASIFRMTPAASALMDPMRQLLSEGNARALAGFDEAERAALADMLRRVIDNLAEEEAELDG